MANVHGFNNLNENNNRGARQPMLGVAQINDGFISEQIRSNKIPFLNAMTGDRPPLEETVPYTIKLVWCPTFSLKTVCSVFLICIWVMYLVCLIDGGINYDSKSGVLAPKLQALKKYGANNYYLLKNGEVWRLLTFSFLHKDLLHITMNSISILFFLSRLEVCYNAGLISILMFFSSISSGIMSATVNKQNSYSVGASGIIFGVMGGYLAFMTINWAFLGPVRSQLCCIIGIMIFMSIIFSFSEGVDFAGHFGGLIGGYFCSLAIFPGLMPKHSYLTIAGLAGLTIYLLTMFLVFYLAK